jgi:methionine synthase II (cobalamin-independent)
MEIPARCRATAIGSFPHFQPDEAIRIILENAPEIPVWPQLPAYPEEGMIIQYVEGMPGLVTQDNKTFFDTSASRFESDLLAFYEHYLEALELDSMPEDHQFGLSRRFSRGMYALLDALHEGKGKPLAVKGQVTGPVTLATSLKDQDGKDAYFDARLREVVVKTLALKARWQIHQFRFLGLPAIIFIDEPSLAAYGSTAFLGISEDDVTNDIQEIIDVIHAEGALAGIHCCENTDWGILIKTGCDILNFDAYSFFDKVLLYVEAIKDFLQRDKVLAWGLIPTANADDIERETPSSLVRTWDAYLDALSTKGIDRRKVVQQALITPSCGTGSLTPELSQRVMELLREVSENLQQRYFASQTT